MDKLAESLTLKQLGTLNELKKQYEKEISDRDLKIKEKLEIMYVLNCEILSLQTQKINSQKILNDINSEILTRH